MTPQQPTPSQPKIDWSKPAPQLDEKELVRYLALPLTTDNLQSLLVSNMFTVQDAYDRRVTAPNFHEILITSMNFNNFMARTAMMEEVIEALISGEFTTTWAKERMSQLRSRASDIREDIFKTLWLLHECRQPDDPVS